MRNIITILLVFSVTASFCQTKHELDSLTNLLEKVSADDQQYRLVWDSTMQKYGINSPEFTDLIQKINRQDSINMNIVGNVLDNYGWLSKQQTSEDANSALFLVIQHAPLQSQLKYLSLMSQAVRDKKAKPSEYALLVDRTNMYQGKLQTYGSQLNYDAKGKLHIFPIADEPNLDKRRKSVGLPLMQEYLNLLNSGLKYTLPKTDRYKNKLIIKGSITDKLSNQPLSNVSIYSINGNHIGQSDSSGFFQVIINKPKTISKILFKKKYFKSMSFKTKVNNKEVLETNLIMTKQ